MLYATVRQRKIYVKAPITVIRNGVNVDTLILDMDDEWQEMTSIVCVLTNGDTAKQLMHTFGQPLLVPWELLVSTGTLILSVTGYVGEEKIMTTAKSDTGWNIVQNGPATGTDPTPATPTLLQQVLAAANSATSAATAANEAASAANEAKSTLESAAANGDFDGATGPAGADGHTPVKGTDYWTAADQAEIVQATLAALPTWTGGSY